MVHPSFVAKIISMAEKGWWPAQWAAEFRVSKKTLWTWASRYPNLAEAMQAARTILQAHWEEKAATNIVTSGFQGPTWKTLMQAHFPEDYTPKQIVDTTNRDGDRADLGKLTKEELDEEIAKHESARQAIVQAKGKVPANKDMMDGPPTDGA